MSTKYNLFSYVIATGGTGTASYTHSAGVDLETWNDSELNGNDAFIISTYSEVNDYKNISSISNWYNFGGDTELRHGGVHHQISHEYNTLVESGMTWSSFPEDEKKILSTYFIVDKPFRDEVHTQQEQDANDHFILYHLLSKDAEERLGNYSMRTTPKSIDYKKDLEVRLHPKYTFDIFGWLIEAEYFQDLVVGTNGQGFHIFTYSNPVVKYNAEYTLEPSGYVGSRTIDRSWYLVSGSYSTDVKTSFKIYEPLSARAEGRIRRKNLISALLIDTVGLIIMTSNDLDDVLTAEADAIPFMKDIQSDISAYYESGTKVDALGNPCALIQAINTHTYSRLDNWVPGTGDTVSIRMFILNRLDPQ